MQIGRQDFLRQVSAQQEHGLSGERIRQLKAGVQKSVRSYRLPILIERQCREVCRLRACADPDTDPYHGIAGDRAQQQCRNMQVEVNDAACVQQLIRSRQQLYGKKRSGK